MTDREKAANHMPPPSRAERLELEGDIKETNRRFERMHDTGRKTALLFGAVATATAVTAGVLFGGIEKEGQAEPIDFDNAANHLNEDGVNIIETPDGMQYEGVWLDGDTGSSWADLELTRKERQQVLDQNGLDAVPNHPTTVFVETSLLDRE